MHIRPARWEDLETCLAIDPSYVTDRVWQMEARPLTFPLVGEGESAMTFTFRSVQLPRPMHVPYPRSLEARRADWYHRDGFLVAEEEGADLEEPPPILGYVTLSAQPWHDAAWIGDLVVAPEHRRQGVGTALLQAAVEWAQQEGLGRLILEVQPRNHPAISFAQHRGFVFCGFHDRYYADRDIALFFELSLR